MSHSLRLFLHAIGSLCLDGKIREVAQHFSYPLPFSSPEEMIVFGNAETLGEGLVMYRKAMAHLQVTHVIPEILSEKMTGDSYSKVLVRWSYLDGAGNCLHTSEVFYVLFQAPDDLAPRIEFIDYTTPMFPEVIESTGMLAFA